MRPLADRRVVDSEAEALIVLRARKLINPNSTCFFNSGTTIFALAETLYREPSQDYARLSRARNSFEHPGKDPLTITNLEILDGDLVAPLWHFSSDIGLDLTGETLLFRRPPPSGE